MYTERLIPIYVNNPLYSPAQNKAQNKTPTPHFIKT